MKNSFNRFALLLAVALVCFVAPKQAAAQIEDWGYIQTVLQNYTGCNPSYQSCMVTQCLQGYFGGNMEAMEEWGAGIAATFSVFWNVIGDDAGWINIDWPLIRSTPTALAKPRVYFPEFEIPLVAFPRRSAFRRVAWEAYQTRHWNTQVQQLADADRALARAREITQEGGAQ